MSSTTTESRRFSDFRQFLLTQSKSDPSSPEELCVKQRLSSGTPYDVAMQVAVEKAEPELSSHQTLPNDGLRLGPGQIYKRRLLRDNKPM